MNKNLNDKNFKLSSANARVKEQCFQKENQICSLEQWLSNSPFTKIYVSFLDEQIINLRRNKDYSFYDYGCGDTWLGQFLAGDDELICFDSYEKVIKIAKRNLDISRKNSILFSNKNDFWESFRNNPKSKVFIFHQVAEFLEENQIIKILNKISEVRSHVILIFASSTYRRFSIQNFTTSFLGGYKKYQKRVGTKIFSTNNFRYEKFLRDKGFKIKYKGGAFFLPTRLMKKMPFNFYSRLIHVQGLIPGYLSRSSIFISSIN